MKASRALSGCACAVLIAASAGCTAASSSQTVSGKTLNIYISFPPPAALNNDPQMQDVIRAETLAFNQLHGAVTAFKLNLLPVKTGLLSENAREVISDNRAIAYVGEIQPGASAESIGITNNQDILQVSPTDTAAELTQSTPVIKDAPKRYYESLSTYGRTFARVVPTTAVEAQDVIKEMQSLGIRRIDVVSDSSEYGRVIAQEVTSDASPSIVVSQSGADAVFYGGTGSSSALSHALAANPRARLFVPSALSDDAFVAALPAATQRKLVVSSPGFLPSALSASAKKFAADFKNAYGHMPSTRAIFGYAAMSALINVLVQAGPSANNRGAVVRRFLAISNMQSVLGPLNVNGSGDTNIAAIVFEHVDKAGKLVAFKAA